MICWGKLNVNVETVDHFNLRTSCITRLNNSSFYSMLKITFQQDLHLNAISISTVKLIIKTFKLVQLLKKGFKPGAATQKP